MMRAILNVDLNSLGRTKADLVIGELWLAIDGVNFPSKGWTDFIIVVLGYWCRAIFLVANGEKKPLEIRFMDGPYLVELGPLIGDLVHMELVDAGLNRVVRLSGDVDFDSLSTSLISAAEKSLAECKKRKWWSSDADELASALNALTGSGWASR